MDRSSARTSFLLILFLCAGACDPSARETLPKEEYLELGHKVADAFNSRQTEFIKQRFLQTPIYEALLLTLDSLGLELKEHQQGERIKIKLIADRFEEQIDWITESLEGENVRFISFTGGAQPYLLFGIQLGDYLDFMEMEVTTMGDHIYITDLYRYYSGIRYSEYVIWSEVNEAYYGRLGGPFQDALGELYNASVYLERGQPARALNAYERIPEEFAYHPRFHGLKQEIAQYLGDSMLEQSLFEKIGYHWSEKKTRYSNLIAYYRHFTMPDTSLLYVDSLEALTGANYLIDTLRFRIAEDTPIRPETGASR